MSKGRGNISLIGCMGAGKTTVGSILALRLEKDFVDTDALIEKRAGMSIPDIFEKMGEKHFRELETDVISTIADACEQVTSVGGGAIADKRNRELIHEFSSTVYLKAEAETLCARLKKGDRPLLQSLDRLEALERMRQILDERKPFYEEADIVVQVDEKTLHEVADDIVAKVRRLGL